MKSERLEEVSRELENPNVWDNPQRAQELGKERANLERIVGGIRTLTDALGEAGDLLDLAIGENDADDSDDEYQGCAGPDVGGFCTFCSCACMDCRVASSLPIRVFSSSTESLSACICPDSC